MPESDIAIAQRIRTITPQLTGPNTFHIVAGNPLVEKAMKKICKQVEAYVAEYCHISNVTMTISVAEAEAMILTYSKPEQFRQMLKDSPSFAKLHEFFALELA